MRQPRDLKRDDYTSAFLAGLAPDPLLTVSQWADTHRRLSQRASAEPGIWQSDARAPLHVKRF